MIRLIRDFCGDEDGQAIVIAALGLLLLAFAVLGTATLGNSIQEKVRLQNTADAAAYSMAALEARTFNFYAFTNRTMVSHYVAIMTLQSYIAVAGFVMSAVNTVRLIVRALRNFCDPWCTKPLCEAVKAIPGVGNIIRVLQQLVTVIDDVLQRVANTLQNVLWGTHRQPSYPVLSLNLDRVVGWIAIPFFLFMNAVLYVAQTALMNATTLTLAGAADQVIAGTYDTIRPRPDPYTAPGVALLARSAFEWDRAHDPTAMNLTPFGKGGRHAVSDRLRDPMESVDEGVARAERVMTEISNATRWNRFLFNRSLDGTTSGSILEVVSRASFGLFEFHLHGTTKLITDSKPSWNVARRNSYDLHDVRAGVDGHARYPQGGSMVADQWIDVSFAFVDYDMTEDRLSIPGKSWRFSPGVRHSAVAATHKEFTGRWGWHCVTHLTPPNQSLCIIKTVKCICKIKNIYKIDPDLSSCHRREPGESADSKGNHPWWGIFPFMKFNPKADGSPLVAFHQPSTYVWLTQPPENIDIEPLLQRDVLGLGGHTATHDTGLDHVTEGGLPPGFHAFARAAAYYHRPGNWREHPNFFNPFWRARLAPVQPVLSDLVGDLGAGAVLGDALGKSFITH
ncbi:MAG: pilus assembly protein TadG-related protein [Deltaproteobacteria bacterium]|nr:pilus assembly protein TadG-related protein [Deltaproteobacteria bacterium]